jgi:hypothetical protein
MADVLLRRRVTTLDVADASMLLDDSEQAVLRERFGFSPESMFSVSLNGEPPGPAWVEGDSLFLPGLHERSDLVNLDMDFVYHDGMLVATIPGDPFAEDALKLASLQAQVRDAEKRIHLEMQSKLARIGWAEGYHVWVAGNDREAVQQMLGRDVPLLVEFPVLTQERTVNARSRLIDVVFVPKGPNQVIRLFEVEATTSIYSGLLRMSDFHCWRMDCQMAIVSHISRFQKFKGELARPTFQPIANKVRFMSFDEVDSMLRVANQSESSLEPS